MQLSFRRCLVLFYTIAALYMSSLAKGLMSLSQTFLFDRLRVRFVSVDQDGLFDSIGRDIFVSRLALTLELGLHSSLILFLDCKQCTACRTGHK